jgi:hypothetical protein
MWSGVEVWEPDLGAEAERETRERREEREQVDVSMDPGP